MGMKMRKTPSSHHSLFYGLSVPSDTVSGRGCVIKTRVFENFAFLPPSRRPGLHRGARLFVVSSFSPNTALSLSLVVFLSAFRFFFLSFCRFLIFPFYLFCILSFYRSYAFTFLLLCVLSFCRSHS